MTEPVFDAAGHIKLNLESGSISSKDEDGLAVIPLDLLASIQPDDSLRRRTRAWGERVGENLAVMALEADGGTLDMLAEHLAGALAVAGFGKVRIEVRGDALMFRLVSKCGEEARGGLALLAGEFLAGYLSTVISPDRFDVVPLEQSDEGILFWAGNPRAASKVEEMLEDGAKPLEALDAVAQGGTR